MALTILQALKRIKHLDRKIKTSQERIAKWASYIEPTEAPPQYEVKPLLQSVSDMLTERAQLRHSIHVANVLHKVTYKDREMSIDELLILRTVTVPGRVETLKLLRRKEKPYHLKDEKGEIKVVMQYDPKERDRTVDALENEVDEIDHILDDINITLDISSVTK